MLWDAAAQGPFGLSIPRSTPSNTSRAEMLPFIHVSNRNLCLGVVRVNEDRFRGLDIGSCGGCTPGHRPRQPSPSHSSASTGVFCIRNPCLNVDETPLVFLRFALTGSCVDGLFLTSYSVTSVTLAVSYAAKSDLSIVCTQMVQPRVKVCSV